MVHISILTSTSILSANLHLFVTLSEHEARIWEIWIPERWFLCRRHHLEPVRQPHHNSNPVVSQLLLITSQTLFSASNNQRLKPNGTETVLSADVTAAGHQVELYM